VNYYDINIIYFITLETHIECQSRTRSQTSVKSLITDVNYEC